ncbi:MAG: DUF87 domain-containing protein [Alphaproteobacteria bacterium]|nr:MAG: DUF87 domain-containing protein [Alphaproteobacteria bacterium]
MSQKTPYLSQGLRVLILILNILTAYAIYAAATGHYIISSGGETLWLVAAIAMWLVSLISAPWFSPPKDTLISSITVLAAVLTLDTATAISFVELVNILQLVSTIFSIVLIVSSIAAIIASANDSDVSKFRSIQFFNEKFGQERFIFSLPVFLSILGFYPAGSATQALLWLAWFILVVLNPVEIIVSFGYRLYLQRSHSNLNQSIVGTITRVDHPNIVRAIVPDPATWRGHNIFIASLPGDRLSYCLPLYTQIRDDEVIGTGICYGQITNADFHAEPGKIYQSNDHSESTQKIIETMSGYGSNAVLVGFVVEGSSIGEIRFEVTSDQSISKGFILFCKIGASRVFYQVLDAQTSEESFQQNPRGTHIVNAVQIGTFDPDKGFQKFQWLPSMNQPVFKVEGSYTEEKPESDGKFSIGTVPTTDIPLEANIDDLIDYHSAILGTTGTGKTEFAFEVIEKAVASGAKVFCVDLTGEYLARLAKLKPLEIGLGDNEVAELEEAIFAAETGDYGGGREKKVLNEFVTKIKDSVHLTITSFLEDERQSVGVLALTEISNTKATLRLTELYLSSIMEWARKNRKARRILLVLEEAHTIIPETAGAGFDHTTQWVVSRIGQIALQGRKYGVGLLLVSQRTALVSKTVLSQCNTYFVHSLVDQTSLTYLSNVLGSEHVKSIPNLAFLEFIASGKGIKSERPIIIKRSFDGAKYQASLELDVSSNS